MKKILIPTDGSELGDYAYHLAHRIAETTGATIDILSVVVAPAEAFFDPNGNLKDDEGEDFSEYQEKKRNLHQQLNDWAGDKPDISSVTVKIGSVDEDIANFVQQRAVDLVVMGMHHTHGLDEVLRGSHVNHISRLATVPILSLKCDRGELHIKDIVLVSDFEEGEGLQLKALRELLSAFSAKLHLLKINTPKHFSTQIEARSKMENFAAANGFDDASCHLYSDKSIEEGIEHFSLEHQIDVITLGFQQPQGLNRLFNQDVNRKIVNHLYHPILMLPS